MSLENWLNRQARQSEMRLRGAISATHLSHTRPDFGQTVIPAPGSVLASTVSAAWDPEPDYFFHWIRDSAIVMRSVVALEQDTADEKAAAAWRAAFEQFVTFSLSLTNEKAHAAETPLDRARIAPEYHRHLRDDADCRSPDRDQLMSEPRFNPDGTMDRFNWSRPQYDGPALRALACLQFTANNSTFPELDILLQRDLDFTSRHADAPCIGPWEEPGEMAHHYYVGVVQLGALVHGHRWATARGDRDFADACQRAAETLRTGLAQHWREDLQIYTAIREKSGTAPADLLDAAAILAVLDAEIPGDGHSLTDPRVHATVNAIENLFDDYLPVNRNRPPDTAPAIGRNAGDTYFGGGAWYPATLGFACYYYRRAADKKMHTPAIAADDLQKGDRFMATTRRFAPTTGDLPEQFDRETGEPRSCRDLAWSHAAFLNAVMARRQALDQVS